MNKYGSLAMQRVHAEALDRFRQTGDPETVFEDLGERIAAQTDQVASLLEAQNVPAGETYLERVGRLNSIRLQAEDAAMAEALEEYLPVSGELEGDLPSRERVDELIAILQARRGELATEEFTAELTRLQGLYR
ncbi:hypothetical protein HQQ88_17250 [Curtobacterium sp. VKM Ac-2861]|uniref:hypothetical protein n=1 Tax=Curtobacterium sp. VKM Ac-2861 TaxID=2739016 RepID=UPI001566C1DE|nr:hypothetical protein [Curtobacterium sp. VKM Ac-2861]